MNKTEARAVLARHLAGWRNRAYQDLAALIGKNWPSAEVTGPSGEWYQIEVNVHWDDKPGGDVRVFGSIDDGGWRAFFPLCDSFIMASDGSFVDEDDPETLPPEWKE